MRRVWVQGPSILESFRKVRIGNEQAAKAAQIGRSTAEHSFRSFLGETDVTHERALESNLHVHGCHRLAFTVVSESKAVHDAVSQNDVSEISDMFEIVSGTKTQDLL